MGPARRRETSNLEPSVQAWSCTWGAQPAALSSKVSSRLGCRCRPVALPLCFVVEAADIVWAEVTRHVAFILRTWFESDKALTEGRDGKITSQRASMLHRACETKEASYRRQLATMLPNREWLLLSTTLDTARPTSSDLPGQKTKHLRTTPGQAKQAVAFIDNLRQHVARIEAAKEA